MASRKGSPNKLGAQARENIAAVFNRVGGTNEMANWARRHRSEFYKLYARLVPSEFTGTIDLRDSREMSEGELIDIASGGSPRVIEQEESQAELNSLHLLPGPGVPAG